MYNSTIVPYSTKRSLSVNSPFHTNREYDSTSGRINKVVATNPDGAKIEFRADPPSDGEGRPVRKKSPYKAKPRIVDPGQ